MYAHGRGLKVAMKLLMHAAALFGLWVLFRATMFLGLQVNPTYGDLGVIATGVALVLYIYFGFFHRRR